MPPLVNSSIRSFVALAERGTLTLAAEAVNKSASAVSLQITALENRLGRQLFVRSAKGMQLSEAGKLLLSHVRLLLEIESAACLELRALEIKGNVRFGMPEDFASSRLASTLTKFRRAHPCVQVDGIIKRNKTIASMARSGELDLAMVITRRRTSSSLVTSRRRSHWYASTEFSWDRAVPLPLVLLDGPCIYREDALAALKRAGIHSEVAFSTENITAMWAAVASGIGVSARMDLSPPKSVVCVDEVLGLPRLPSTSVSLLQVSRSANEAIFALASLVEEALMEPVCP